MNFLIVLATYVLSHGLTTYVVAPTQSIFLPQETIFASLLFLPHGVRVLATWAYGWKAVPYLVVASILSAWMFRRPEDIELLKPAILEGIILGALSAYFAFELLRVLGWNLYFGSNRKVSWKGMIAVGVLSSIINSMGQTLIFSGLINLDQIASVLVIYAVGDLLGLVTCMVILMFVFRWMRNARPSKLR